MSTTESGPQTVDPEFTAFVRTCAPGLLRTARLLGADDHRADDLVQATLVKTYLAWPRARATDPEAYARRVLANQRIDTWRARRREVLTEPADLPQTPGDTRSDPVATAAADRDEILAALLTLTERQRRIVVLRHLVGLTDAEVAADLGVSVGTVKSTSSRALAQLRDTLLRERSAADATHIEARLARAAAGGSPDPVQLAAMVTARAAARRRRRTVLAAGATALALVAGVVVGASLIGPWDRGARSATNAADYPAYAGATELGAAADLVVEGVVLDATERDIDIVLGPDVQLEPFTVYRMRVDRAYRGAAEPGEVVEVAVSRRAGPEPEPRLAVDASYVLFLGESFEGRPRHLLNPDQAVYRVGGDGALVAVPGDGPLSLSITRADLAALAP